MINPQISTCKRQRINSEDKYTLQVETIRESGARQRQEIKGQKTRKDQENKGRHIDETEKHKKHGKTTRN